MVWFGGLVWSVKLEQCSAWRYNKAELPGLRPRFRDFFGMVWFGGLVWFANLNKLVLGDMFRHNFQDRAHCLRFSLAWYGLAVWDGLQNLNKLALGDMTRQNFQVRGLTLRIFLV